MQPIERYGLIALVFLGITITAACFWDPEPSEAQPADAALRPAARLADGGGAPAAPRDFVGARTQERRVAQGLTAGQRQKLLALQDAELESELGLPPLDERGAEAAAAAKADEQPLGDRLQQGASDLLASAGERARALGARLDPSEEVQAAPGSALDPRARQRAAEPPRKRTYVVKKGDTLSEIALSELGTSKRWQEIVAANPGLDPNRVREGLVLVMPAGGATADAAPRETAARDAAPKAREASKPEPADKGLTTYVVKEADSLWKIAAAALGDGERWGEIAKLNPSIDPDRLIVGQRLALPAGAREGAAAEPAPRKDQAVASAEQPSGRKVR